MKNFLRAVKVAFRYPWTLAATVACSIIVAGLWGANIGALYPIFQVTLAGQPLQVWVDERIETSKIAIEGHEERIAELTRELKQDEIPEDVHLAGQLELGGLRTQLATEQATLVSNRHLKPYIDKYMPHDCFQTVVLVVLLVMVGMFLRQCSLIAGTMSMTRLSGMLSIRFRLQFFAKVLNMDQISFGQNGASGMMTHMSADITGVVTGLKQLFGSAVREPLKMLACLVLAGAICWRLLIFTLIMAPVAALLVRGLGSMIRRTADRTFQVGLGLNRLVFGAFNGLQVVQAYTSEEYEQHRYGEKTMEGYRKGMKMAFYTALSKSVIELLGMGAVCIALIAGAYLVLNGQTHIFGFKISDKALELPDLLLFFGALVGMNDPIRRFSGIFGDIQNAFVAADRLFPILNRQSLISDPLHPRPLPTPLSEITLEGVSFHYHSGQPVLHDVNLKIQAGETLAVVGANGCGKSTLINMLPRFLDPVEGQVRINGVDLKDLSFTELRGQIGYVTQQTLLFDDTVVNNIRYGSPEATDAQVISAAKQARADAFITSVLKNGYQTMVGEKGSRLSGGQRQRIALARAILRNPAIVILDEATNQIDPESEVLIHQALETFLADRTALIITHRLSTLDLAQRIMVMEEGRIVDIGTHEQLLTRCQLYQNLRRTELKKSA